ncbi:hypothetical protein KAFR_0C02720 [Kazachstania africana CBS 2517]|uniref:ADF-H domain-containing protein n=1 Tax=Kazachstania africana (strain ATCC 22294 / BCRC 22015 / CBS 2517 / CECT 1963 / NBRC 1671 / NRRL Y-8276) TaxID=1071382 RepID=H2ASB5_KAZAF|nr:hypothetical protein KAFR_0C02720 [Kazachstania africana CBS 2517]CCF57265.1 hypothetical protein KAFR_0C02720 [Kazachstania africana CBS 2517]
MTTLYNIPTGTRDVIRKFRTSTSRSETIRCLPIKIEANSNEIIIDEDDQEELDEITDLASLAEILPDNSPRFLLMAYPLTTKEGIKQVPLILLYWKPMTIVSQEWKMLYAGAAEMVKHECGTYKFIEVSSDLEDDDDVEELKEQIETSKR